MNFNRIHTKKEAKIRLFIDGVLWITRSGAQWRLLPREFGKWNTVYQRFRYWVQKGIWQSLFEHFSTDKDLEYIMIDASVIRAHACAAGAKNGGDQVLAELADSQPQNKQCHKKEKFSSHSQEWECSFPFSLDCPSHPLLFKHPLLEWEYSFPSIRSPVKADTYSKIAKHTIITVC